MTQPAFVSAASVREYLELNAIASSSRYTDATLGSNIRAASWALERATGRIFADSTRTLLFTTNGAAYLTIPRLRAASAVTLQGSALAADASYWLTPDSQQTGVSTGIQLRAFGTQRQGAPSYLSNPEWFDRGLDMRNRWGSSSLPNDLSIAGSWGYTDLPEPLLHATKVLASFYTLRPDAILAGAVATPDGGSTDLSNLPVEVQNFIVDWRVGPWAFGL